MSHRDVTGAMADHWKTEHDKVKNQRNQLREALESCVNAFKTTNVYNGAVHYAQDEARAALKATEEG